MDSYLQGLFATVLFVAIMSFVTGCGAAEPIMPSEQDGSIVTAVDGVSGELRKEVQLTYKLLCNADRAKLDQSVVASVDDVASDTSKSVSFKVKNVAVGDFCALEIAAKNPSAINDGAYEWTSKPVRKGLFYATEATKLAEGRKLSLVLHKLYKGGNGATAGNANDDVSVVVTPGSDCEFNTTTKECVGSNGDSSAIATQNLWAFKKLWKGTCRPAADGGSEGDFLTLESDAGNFALSTVGFKDAECKLLHGFTRSSAGRYTFGSPDSSGRRPLELVVSLGIKPAMTLHLLASLEGSHLVLSLDPSHTAPTTDLIKVDQIFVEGDDAPQTAI